MFDIDLKFKVKYWSKFGMYAKFNSSVVVTIDGGSPTMSKW